MSGRGPRPYDALIESGMKMVEHEANATTRTLPKALRTTDIEKELVAFGYMRLVELAKSHDADRASFVTYARPHVHWAMLRFAYRGQVPEHVRIAHLHFHREGRSAVDGVDMDETPAIAEAKAVDWAKRELAGLTAQWAFEYLPPDQKLEIREMQARVRGTIARVQATELTPEERWFVDRHYGGGVKFIAIAEKLGCNERTVRRMRDRIEELFRERFAESGIDSVGAEVD